MTSIVDSGAEAAWPVPSVLNRHDLRFDRHRKYAPGLSRIPLSLSVNSFSARNSMVLSAAWPNLFLEL